MKYFLLECFARDYGAVISKEPHLKTPLDNWMLGNRFTVNVPEPLDFIIDKFDEGELLPLFNIGSYVLVTLDLENTLRNCGVLNFDSYDAEIHLESNGDVVLYKAINIIGVVSATNFEESDGVNLTKDLGVSKIKAMFFRKLTIDSSKIHSLKMFRLAESLSKIYISEDVKICLETSGDKKLRRLSFLEAKIT